MNLSAHLKFNLFRVVSQIAALRNEKAYVIGGYVRDILLKRNSKDIDIVVIGNGIDFAAQVAVELGKKKIQVYKNFGTAAIYLDDITVEFVGARKESYSKRSRNPIVETGTMQDDQNRRDFTINALAIDLSEDNYGELIDPFNGIEDLQKGIIRTPLDPDITFSDDPLRMLRAIRFATQLSFFIDKECMTAIKSNAGRLEIISIERITEELNKILLSPKPSQGIILLSNTGLLKYFLPQVEAMRGVDVIEKQGHKDNFYHSIEVLDKIAVKSDNLWLRWAALLHDVGKPATKKFIKGAGWTFHGHHSVGSKITASVFKGLKLPMNENLKYVQKLIFLHLRPASLVEENVTDSAVRRLLFEAGDDIDDLMLLAEADITSKNIDKVINFHQNYLKLRKKIIKVEEKDKLRNWQPPISGEVIMQTFNIPPCKEVGVIKDAIRDAILDGIIENDYDEAFKYMMEQVKKLDLKKNN